MTTEYIYHLTATELRDLMLLAIAKWEALDRDVTAAVDAALAEDNAKRLENSLPLVEEPLLCACGHEERWHDNEDGHCDKRLCQSYEPNEIEDEDTIFAEALLNDELACPYCDGVFIVTRSGNQIAAICSQCGHKELVENKPDNISPAAIGLEPAV